MRRSIYYAPSLLLSVHCQCKFVDNQLMQGGSVHFTSRRYSIFIVNNAQWQLIYSITTLEHTCITSIIVHSARLTSFSPNGTINFIVVYNECLGILHTKTKITMWHSSHLPDYMGNCSKCDGSDTRQVKKDELGSTTILY